MSAIGGDAINVPVINGGDAGVLYIYLTAYQNADALPEVWFLIGTAGTSVLFTVAPDPGDFIVAPDPAPFMVGR